MDRLTHAGIVDRARTLGERLSRHEAQADRDRRLPDAAIEELVQSGLVRLIRPARLGGCEAPPTTYVEALREVATHSMSGAWILQVLSVHEWFMAYARPELQEELWGHDRDALVVDSVAPIGEAEAVDGGFRLSGRWRFVSGVEWCSWAALGAVVELPDGDGRPEPCLFVVPREDFQVADEWHSLGLRGTASNTVTVERAFVPEHRLFTLARVAASGEPMGERLDDGLLFRVPWTPMLAAAIYPAVLGGAQRAVAELRTWTEQRLRPYEAGAQQRESPHAQLAIAEAAARIDGAHALAHRYAATLERYAADGRSALSEEERARLFAWRALIARTSVETVDRLYAEAGANALFPEHPMQQLFRDVRAAGAHVSLTWGDALTSYSRTMMGHPGHPVL